MKGVFTADIHVNPFRECSQDGGRDRMADGLNALRQTLQYASQKEVPWFCLGDFKQIEGQWHVLVQNGILEVFEEYEEVNKYLVHGNHDGLDDKGLSGLTVFKRVKNTWLFDRPVVFGPGGSFAGVAIWPHQKSLERLPEFLAECRKQKARILLGHFFLSGASTGPAGVKLLKPISLETLGLLQKPRLFDWVILGDVHKQQRVRVPGAGEHEFPQVWYPGDPYSQNWGELETAKGCLYIDTGARIIEELPVKAPRFRVIEIDSKFTPRTSIDDHVREQTQSGDFVKVILPPGISYPVDPPETLRHFQAITLPSENKDQRAPTIHAGLSKEDLVTEYVKARPLEGFKEKDLVKVGVNLLGERS